MNLKSFAFLISISLFTFSAIAQAPAKLNYQAVVRNSGGTPLANGTVVSVLYVIMREELRLRVSKMSAAH